MTNREAAKILLYKLSRNVSEDKYMDAICLAICALMREEEVGKGKHEERIKIPQEPPLREEDGIGWHDAISDPPPNAGCYYVKESADSEKIWFCLFNGRRWYPDYMDDAGIKVRLWIKPDDLKRMD